MDGLTRLAQSVIDALGEFGDALGGLLHSPFDRISYVIDDSQVLQMLNWLIPISEMVALLQAWALAVAAWYVAMTVLRWAKTIS